MTLRSREIVWCCAFIHLVFVLFMYGHKFSWVYDPYFLVIGVAASESVVSLSRAAFGAIAFAALLGTKTAALSSIDAWKSSEPNAEIGMLWTSPSEAREWGDVRRLLHASGGVLITASGGAKALFPDLHVVPIAIFGPGLATPLELEKLATAIKNAPNIVLVTRPGFDGELAAIRYYPIVNSAIGRTELVYRGHDFDIYRRELASDHNVSTAIPDFSGGYSSKGGPHDFARF